MSGHVDRIAMPDGSRPSSIAFAPNGDKWVTLGGSEELARIAPDGTVSRFSLADDNPNTRTYPGEVVVAGDGSVWFSVGVPPYVGHVTPNGAIEWVTLPGGAIASFLTIGPDNNVWVSAGSPAAVYRITLGGAVTKFPVGAEDGRLGGITTGSDGNLWVADDARDAFVRLTPAGEVTRFPVPAKCYQAFAATGGGDGNVWFTCPTGVGRITSSGVVTVFDSPDGKGGFDIERAPDGSVWLTGNETSRIARVTADGTMSILASVPGRPLGAAFGPDGRLWYASSDESFVGVLS